MKYKAKQSNSHDHRRDQDAPKSCPACQGRNRAHTCGKKGKMSRLPKGKGFGGLFQMAASTADPAETVAIGTAEAAIGTAEAANSAAAEAEAANYAAAEHATRTAIP